MKKITILLIAFSLCACSTNNTQMVNPWISYTTLNEAKSNISFDVICPKVKGATYQVMNKELFEMDYEDISLRKSKSNEDISGDYNEYDHTWDMNCDGISVFCKGKEDKIHCAVWYRESFAYSMTSQSGITEEKLHNIISNFK